jgi:hypothetical protein
MKNHDHSDGTGFAEEGVKALLRLNRPMVAQRYRSGDWIGGHGHSFREFIRNPKM